jgi:hypothetical protein
MGAIFELEQLAEESQSHHWPVTETLAASIREASARPPQEADGLVSHIQAAIPVLGRRDRSRDKRGRKLDLRGADLKHMDLSGLDLAGADLTGATVAGSNLCGTDLRGVNLHDLKNARGAPFNASTKVNTIQRVHLKEKGAVDDDEAERAAQAVRDAHARDAMTRVEPVLEAVAEREAVEEAEAEAATEAEAIHVEAGATTRGKPR